ncbi:hypothetical protein STAS_02701 [Striga asiatica]|uniref:Uncharacterized protein n=1 Tax=Striga asiatica TaxID=4170 RepID=A0A5A7P381_STRAF|nr:hypothetical protein STAS_02701 [Striga asiatica]
MGGWSVSTSELEFVTRESLLARSRRGSRVVSCNSCLKKLQEVLVVKLTRMANKVGAKCKDTINILTEKIVLWTSNLKKKADKLKEATLRNSNEFASTVSETVRRVAGDWKEGVHRFSHKFKT